MKKVLLIDVDSTIPNLALMKISAFHKAKGDEVGFKIKDPDLVYASIIFTENKHKLYFIKDDYPNAEIQIGGSGYSFEVLQDEIDRIMPDYSLYNANFSIGMTTRGCIRNCPFCVVRRKEGHIRKYMHISDFHQEDHKEVMLLDNNILALKDHFMENMDYIMEKNLKVDFNQGLDVRLLDDEILEILKKIRFKELRFAWDDMATKKIIMEKLDIIVNNFEDLKHNVSFYALVDFNTNIIEDLERVDAFRSREILCYIMPYQKIYEGQSEPLGQKHITSLERYCNKRNLYFKYDNYWQFLKGEYSLKYYLKILNEYNKIRGVRNGKD